MNILSFTELSDDSVGGIFTTILGAFLQRNFGADINSLADKVSSGVVLHIRPTGPAHIVALVLRSSGGAGAQFK
jgi:hypothetical protein